MLWLAVGLIILVLTIFPGLLDALGRATGVALPVNLLFFVGIIFLVLVALHLSWELSRVEHETRKLAEDIGILRLELDEYKRQRHSELCKTRDEHQ